MPAMLEASPIAPPAFAGARLLQDFYARRGLLPPETRVVAALDVPPPYHQLLVHSQDMTPTLEKYFRQRIQVRALHRHGEGHYYYREVILRAANAGRPVEYGVIKMDLALFAPGTRQKILEVHYPLGRILHDEAIAHTSWPRAFFQVEADEHLKTALDFDFPALLYGRRNLLLDGRRKLLADVIEILPPLAAADSGPRSINP